MAYGRHPPIHPTTHCPDPQLSSSQAPGRSLRRSRLILTSSRMYLAWLANQSGLQVSRLPVPCAHATITGLCHPGKPFRKSISCCSRARCGSACSVPRDQSSAQLISPGVLGEVLPGPTPDSQSSAVPGWEQPSLTSSKGHMMLSRASSEQLMLVPPTAPLCSPW